MSERTTIAAKELLDNGDEIFRSDPTLTSLHVTNATGLLTSIVQSPLLGQLTSLGLSGNWVSPADAAAIAQSPNLRNLEHLIMHNCGLGDDGLREFVLCAHFVRLRSLFLTDNGFSDQGLALLANSARFPEVNSLSFGHYGMSPTRCDSITREGLMLLASSSELKNLRTVHWYELTDQRDVPDQPVVEELSSRVKLVTHVEQIW